MAVTVYLSLTIFILFTIVSSSTLTKITVITDGSNGGDGSDFIVSLFWNDNKYNCTFTPNNVPDGTELTCNNPTAIPITPGTYTRYYASFQYAGTTAIQFRSLNVTDGNGDYYAMTDFCIASVMECTFLKHGFTQSVTSCDQYDDKNKYAALALGDKTKFTMLYADYRVAVENYANQDQEGSIRPPPLTELGYEMTGSLTGFTIQLFVQWDTALYNCSLDPSSAVSCTPQTQPIMCPGSPSRNFLSIWNPGTVSPTEVLSIEATYVEDETGTRYYMRNMCLENSRLTDVFYGDSPACTTTGWENYKLIQNGSFTHTLSVGGYNVLGATYDTNLAAFIMPMCLFDDPGDTAPTTEVLVINAGNVQFTGDYGWDENQYGYSPPDCPDTSAPTSTPSESPTTDPTNDPTYDPTIDPTIDPTSDPTIDPTIDPTTDPTIDPTSDPTTDPTIDPTSDPTNDPTIDPTTDPTIDPTIDPTSDPTGVPTKTPTKNPSSPPTRTPTRNPVVPNPTTSPSKSPSSDPTKSPSSYPSNAPTVGAGEEKLITATTIFWGILALAIFLFCCLCCFILIWWKRNKEDEEDENKATPIAAAAVYATHKKEDTYNAYDIGQINTAPSMLDEEDHYGGQYEAKEAIELQRVDEKEEEEIGKQYTIDGAAGTGGTGNKGDEAVLNMLADGHDTGGKYKKEDTEINTQETFAEYNV